MAVLKTINLKKYYGTGENQVKALDDVNLEIEQRGICCHCGQFRKRKIHTFTYAGRFGYPTEGKVLVDNKDIFRLKEVNFAFSAGEKSGLFFKAITWFLC